MKIEDLKVGNKYKNKESSALSEVLYIGNHRVMVKEYNPFHFEDVEFSYLINNFLQKWKPIPKEPKKLGRLYMCLTKHYSKEFDRNFFHRTVKAFPSNPDKVMWQPVTINDKGELFEVLEGE